MSTFKISGTITDADGSKVDFTAIDTPDYNKVVAMSGMGSVGALSTIPVPVSGQYINAETNALAATVPAPTVPWLNATDTLITTLKAASIWSTFDLFYCFAAPTSFVSVYNWVNIASGLLTQNGSITYVANKYAASDGATGWFSTAFTLNSAKASNGNAEFGFFCLNDDTSDNISVFQSNGSKHYLGLTASGTTINSMICGLNTSTAASFSSLWGSSVGHFVVQQNDTSSTLQTFLDGTSLGTSVQTTSVDNGLVQLFKSGSSFTNRQTSFVHYGSKLTSPQQLILSKALYTFLATLGVKPLAGFLGLANGPSNIAPYKHVAIGDGTSLSVPVSPWVTSSVVQGGASGYPHSLILVNDPNYVNVVRCEVHSGEFCSQFDDSHIQRIQISTQHDISWQTTVDLSFSFFIEAGSSYSDWFIDLLDFHDLTTGTNCGPTHALNTSGQYFVWGWWNGTDFISGNTVNCAQGVWHHVRTVWRLDNYPNGFVKSWFDGTQVWNYDSSNSGGRGFGNPASAAFYQQIAWYQGAHETPNTTNPSAVWYANIERDTTGSQPYSSRINNPLPVPPLI